MAHRADGTGSQKQTAINLSITSFAPKGKSG